MAQSFFPRAFDEPGTVLPLRTSGAYATAATANGCICKGSRYKLADRNGSCWSLFL